MVLKATAGLRMLPEEKAIALLKEVRSVRSPPSVRRKRHPSRYEAAPETTKKPLLTCAAKKENKESDESGQLLAMTVGVVDCAE